MSDAEKIIIGAAVVTLAGLVVWLIQSNFNDLKKRLDEIAARMVTREVCAERHRPVTENIKQQSADIRRLFQLFNNEPEETKEG